ncbi:MAG: hypothetical protein AAB649_02815 [Patescibacteria group bacterium]
MKDFENHKMRKLEPEDLIDRDTPAKDLELPGFFLVLASIFNDLKGMSVIYKMREEVYRKPEKDEVNEHAGEYSGMTLQLHKNVIGIIHEALRFIGENEAIIQTPEFKQYENKLSGRSKEIWELVVSVATHKETSPKYAALGKILTQIRSNAAFHYYQSSVPLIAGFRDHFYKEKEHQHGGIKRPITPQPRPTLVEYVITMLMPPYRDICSNV